jgi:hypothetical protein
MTEVLERARRIDASAVDESWSTTAQGTSGDETIIEFIPRVEQVPPHLAEFLVGVRRDLDARASARALERIPPPPQRSASSSRAWWVGAAAAIALGFGLGSWGLRAAGVAATDTSASQAAKIASESRVEFARGHGGSVSTKTPAQKVEVQEEAPQAVSDDVTPPVPVPELEAEPEAAPPPPAGGGLQRRVVRAKSPGEDLALESKAQDAWAAGDLATAEKLLRELIRGTRSRSRREQAYGDLLSVVELRGSAKNTAKLWRDYLRRYPKGRYADDLHARLCRKEAKSRCWDEYLKKHPKGAHRQEAGSASGN